MLTTTGLPAFCAVFTACRIWSDAVTEPPGESTLQHDGLDVLVARRLADGLGQIVAGDAGCWRRAGILGGAVADFARRLDDGDVGVANARSAARAHRSMNLTVLAPAPARALARGARFIVIADAVDQAARARLFGELRAGFQRRDHVGARSACGWRPSASTAGVIDRLHQRGELLAVGRRHLLFHEHVGGAFVFGALGDLGLGLDLVQRCRAGTPRRRPCPTARRGSWAASRFRWRRWRRHSRPGPAPKKAVAWAMTNLPWLRKRCDARRRSPAPSAVESAPLPSRITMPLTRLSRPAVSSPSTTSITVTRRGVKMLVGRGGGIGDRLAQIQRQHHVAGLAVAPGQRDHQQHHQQQDQGHARPWRCR